MSIALSSILPTPARAAWRLCLLALLLSVSAMLHAQSPPLYAVDGVALRGYDPVAYFEGAATPGDEAYRHTWNGAVWKFASDEHMRRFVADPQRYAPQFGGFCALGMAHGGAVPTDPTAFTIHGGKLYLNASHAVRETWAYDPDWMVGRAEPRWQTLLGTVGGQPQRPRPQPQGDAAAADAIPLALGGFDPTSYFDATGPVQGASDITWVWQQRVWRFASNGHRARFKRNPHAYAPQYDGYSALIVAHGGLVPADPTRYTVVDGRLFLEIAPGPQETWRRNAAKLIERADRQWPQLVAK